MVLFSVDQASGGLYTIEGLSFVMIRLLGPELVLAGDDDAVAEVLVEVGGVLETLLDGLAVLLILAVLLRVVLLVPVVVVLMRVVLDGVVPPAQRPGSGQQNGSEYTMHTLNRQSE
jgi:hypothetical protein